MQHVCYRRSFYTREVSVFCPIRSQAVIRTISRWATWTMFICALLGLGLTQTRAKGDKKLPGLDKWPAGPVLYIAQGDELKIYKKLKSDPDRALFIERFWARRDPSPQTLTNEYRQLFWERVQEANTLFIDDSRPGWTTDRGKIHILYGPPQSIEEHWDLQTQSSSTSGHGLIRWVYEGRPGGRQDVAPTVIVPFVRQASGEYRLSYDPRLSSVFFDALKIEEYWDIQNRFDQYKELAGLPRATELSVMLDLGKMQEVPPHAQVILERIETTESYQTQPLDVAIHRYRHPEQGGMIAVVTVDVSEFTGAMVPAVIARFQPPDAAARPRMLGEDSFKVLEEGDRRLVQGRLLLDPGSYDVTVLAANPSTALTGMDRTRINIPAASDRLRLSEIAWANELEPVEVSALATHDEPFIVGSFRVVPRLDEAFNPGDVLHLFFEIYGGSPPYGISYQVEGQEVDGRWIQLGAPAQTLQSAAGQGWDLPTSTRWPLGHYRVRIEVEDAAQTLTSAFAEFELQGAITASAGVPDTDP